MATIPLTVQNPAFNVYPVSPGQAFIATINANGAPIDVSTGWSVTKCYLYPASDGNVDAPYYDLLPLVTFTFTTTGIFIHWTEANWFNPPCLHSNFYMLISSDAGATQTYLAQGFVTLQSGDGQG